MATSNGSHSKSPLLDGDLITNVISMNFSGRFKGQEVKDLGQAVIRHMMTAKTVDLFFGQQANFRLSSLPDNYDMVGSQRAFIIYNRKHLQANDETQYRHFLRDLEMRNRLPKYYLPDANYTLCKIKSKQLGDTSFIVMSWFTDETKEKLRSLNLLRKLLSFTASLCAIEEMPVIIAGSFRLPLDDIKQVVYNEFEGFRCYGYKTDKKSRSMRMCNTFISCPPLKLDEVKPIVYGKIEVNAGGGKPGGLGTSGWRNPEDAFYWDPVYARMFRRSETSSVMSPTSPRALSPPSFENRDDAVFDEEEGDSGSTLQLADCPYADPAHPRSAFPSAEDTLRVLLAESERIRDLVSEAETKARARMEAKNSRAGGSMTTTSDRRLEDLIGSPDKTTRVQADVESIKDSATGGGGGRRSSVEEDVEFRMLEKALDVNTPTLSLGNDAPDRTGTGRIAPADPSEKTSQPGGGGKGRMMLLEVTPPSPLRKMPSYVDLYDEELIDSNKLCYMQ